MNLDSDEKVLLTGALRVLHRVWAVSDGVIATRFLIKESMPLLLDLLKAGRELDDELRYRPTVRSEPGDHECNRPSTATLGRQESGLTTTELLQGHFR